jgi:hypothetical protein
LVIVLHYETAELLMINESHVISRAYRNFSVLICRSLYQESQSEEEFSSPAACVPAVQVMEPKLGPMEDQNGSWCPFPKQPQKQLSSMAAQYQGSRYVDTCTVEQTKTWIHSNTDLPCLMTEMILVHATLFEIYPVERRHLLEQHYYVRDFSGSYKRVVHAVLALGGTRATRGMSLREMLQVSLRAASSYCRSRSDIGHIKQHVKHRIDEEVWDQLGKELKDCLTQMLVPAKNWNSPDPRTDLSSIEWQQLEAYGEANHVPNVVKVAKDVEVPDELDPARRDAEHIAMTAKDVLEMYLTTEAKHIIKENCAGAFVIANRYRDWYDLENYHGYLVNDPRRRDGWPDEFYEEYLFLRTESDAANALRNDKRP